MSFEITSLMDNDDDDNDYNDFHHQFLYQKIFDWNML